MNWNQLHYVVTIAEEKSITKAAQKLYISQPSLSLSIQSLEKETGVILFERFHNQIKLTYAGSLFYEWAKSTLQSHAQLEWKLGDVSDSSRHLLRLGISPHRSTIILPSILKQFYSISPGCDVQIVEKPTYVLKEMLEANTIDLMIDVPHYDTINYQSDVLAEEEIMLAMPNTFVAKLEDKLDSKNRISLSSLSHMPFIMMSSDHIIGQISRRMCESESFFPNTRITCSNVETALSLVNEQLGVAFVPGIFAIQKRNESCIQYLHISQFKETRQLCAIYRKNTYLPSQLQALLSILKEIVPVLYKND